MVGIDLFAGAGGMSLGAKAAGIDVQLVIDSDKKSIETYRHNFNSSYEIFNDDIRKFKKIKLKSSNRPKIIFGGPPCQGFSSSNQRTRSILNINNWLFDEFIRIAESYSADWIVFENVKGFMGTSNGLFLEKTLEGFSKIGYTLSYKLLNAADYGIPQNRLRFIIVGSLNGIKFEFPHKNITKYITVKEAISDLPNLENGANISYKSYRKSVHYDYAKLMRKNLTGCYNHLVTRNSDLIIERFKNIRQGGNWKDIPIDLMKNYKDRMNCHSGIYRRLDENQPSSVIGNFRKNMLIHHNEDRGLSVREAARIQSFPDSFVFTGRLGDQQQQVANAVPPLLAEILFKEIWKLSNLKYK